MNYVRLKRILFSPSDRFIDAAANLLTATGSIELSHLKILAKIKMYSPIRRAGLIIAVFDQSIKMTFRKKLASSPDCRILGTRKKITPEYWNALLREQKTGEGTPAASTQNHLPAHIATVKRENEPLITIITSLHKGGRYIDKFLRMVTQQSIFHECELIIIDANSQDDEMVVINQYLEKFTNIKYVRLPLVVTVYQAWNLAIQMGRAKYITNWNVDDIRHAWSLELQSEYLHRNPDVSVTYQDVYYTLKYDLDFSEIEPLNIRTSLPDILGFEIFDYNAPHNAPMWRRDLHNELGYFEPLFSSAGDWEFWLRCFSAGKTFAKNPEMHVAYYFNPEGLSTSKDSKGTEESKRIRAAYTGTFLNMIKTHNVRIGSVHKH